jgi:hypothetical protein
MVTSECYGALENPQRVNTSLQQLSSHDSNQWQIEITLIGILSIVIANRPLHLTTFIA